MLLPKIMQWIAIYRTYQEPFFCFFMFEFPFEIKDIGIIWAHDSGWNGRFGIHFAVHSLLASPTRNVQLGSSATAAAAVVVVQLQSVVKL